MKSEVIRREAFETTPSLRLGHGRQFTIEDDRFVKDGEPFVLRSGSVHYSRVPRA